MSSRPSLLVQLSGEPGVSNWQEKEVKKLFCKAWKRHASATPSTPAAARSLAEKIELDVGGHLFIPKFTRDWTQCFVRARIADSELDGLRDDPKQFSYPPSAYTARGRANIPKYPVFYAGDDPKTVVKEIGGGIGDRIYAASWKHPGPITYSQFCFDVGTEHRIRRESENTQKIIERTVVKDSQAAARAAAKGVSKMFLAQEHGISSALAHMILYEQKGEAIEYACASSLDTFNYALAPNCADNLEFWRVIHFIEGENQSYYPIEIGRPNSARTKIEWSKVGEDSDPLEDEFFDKNEFGANIRKL